MNSGFKPDHSTVGQFVVKKNEVEKILTQACGFYFVSNCVVIFFFKQGSVISKQ